MSAIAHVYRQGGSAAGWLQACAANIKVREAEVKAWVTLDLEAAHRDAESLDAEARAGNFRSPLHGVPVGIKDLFDVAGLQTLAGSASRSQLPRARADAPIVASLRAAGCIILGKTRTTEYAYLDPTETVNPFNSLHTPGGSSSGSGAAIGAGMAALTLGTQTVGSVCRPAAYCGAAAFKPTTGSTNMSGVVPFSPSYDTAGFFAPRLELALHAWQATCSVPMAGLAPLTSIAGLRFGLPADPYFSGIDAEVSAVLEQVARFLEAAGAIRTRLNLGVDLDSLRVRQRTVMFREAAEAHHNLLEQPEVFARLGRHWAEGLTYGATVTAQAYEEALQSLREIRSQALQQCASVDFLLLPAAKTFAPTLETTGDPGMILPWTIFGNPLTVLPAGLSGKGLPRAVMFAGMPGEDLKHVSIAQAVEMLISQHGLGFSGPDLQRSVSS